MTMPVPTPRDPSSAEVTALLLAAIGEVEGLRPWTSSSSALPWDSGSPSVDISDEGVRVKLVASRLPLPPRLDQAEAAIRRALRGSRWATAPLRLVVTDLDAVALEQSARNQLEV